MDITYLGHASFKLRGSSATVVTDPFSNDVGLKFPNVSADIVCVSHDHGDHNNVRAVKDVKRVISGPGEYEVAGVSIIGIASFHDDKKGEQRGKNTIYILEVDGVRLAHLGDLGHKLSEKVIAEMGEIDVLMIPVGGFYTLDASGAAEVAKAIEANITIPMHFQTQGLNPTTFKDLAGVEPFLSELGLSVEKTNKLSVKKSTIDEDQKIVVLERR